LALEGIWAWAYIMRSEGSRPAGCGALHRRQAVRAAKLRSWHVGQNQSPGLVPIVGSEKAGRGAVHLRHDCRDAKLSSVHDGQNQSPGLRFYSSSTPAKPHDKKRKQQTKKSV
jgi:hypothetical protein